MDKIILGLLMIKPLTIYELRSMIETNFTSMCSSSMGSIQAAIKKLLEKNMVVYEEFVENSVNKKLYTLTEAGKNCFYQWVQTSMTAGKTKDMELSKLFFMGFVPADKRISLIDAYLTGLKKELEQLEQIKRQEYKSAMMEFAASGLNIPDILTYELLTLQFGIDRINFEIDWFEHVKAGL